MMSDLARLDLHDATLDHLTVDWAAGHCTASLRRVGGASGVAVRITWTELRDVSLTRAQPWGPSVSVLEVRALPDGLDELAMQSGDVIRVRAGARHVEDAG